MRRDTQTKEEEQIVHKEVYICTLERTKGPFLQMALDQLEEQDQKTSVDLSSMPFSKQELQGIMNLNVKCKIKDKRSFGGLGLSAEFLGLIPEVDLEEDQLINWISPE